MPSKPFNLNDSRYKNIENLVLAYEEYFVSQNFDSWYENGETDRIIDTIIEEDHDECVECFINNDVCEAELWAYLFHYGLEKAVEDYENETGNCPKLGPWFMFRLLKAVISQKMNITLEQFQKEKEYRAIEEGEPFIEDEPEDESLTVQQVITQTLHSR